MLKSKIGLIKIKGPENIILTSDMISKPGFNSSNYYDKDVIPDSIAFVTTLLTAVYAAILFAVLLLLFRITYIALLRKIHDRNSRQSQQQQSSGNVVDGSFVVPGNQVFNSKLSQFFHYSCLFCSSNFYPQTLSLYFECEQ